MDTNNHSIVRDIEQKIVIDAPIEQVWENVSAAEKIATWFMPNDFQAKEGHVFHLQSPFGPSPCKVTEVDAPIRLSFTWDTDGWIVSFVLKDLGDKTEFTVIHGGWKEVDAVVPKAGEEASVIRDRMNHGWAGLVMNLKKAVEN